MKAIIRAKFVLLVLVGFAFGQSPSDIKLKKQVLINAGVFRYGSELVKDLKEENFRLFVNNKPVEISYVSSQTVPLSVGFLLDSSQSMTSGIDECREGILEFLEKHGSSDEFFVAAFHKDFDTLLEFSSVDEAKITVSASPYFAERRKSSDTILYDALRFGIEKFARAKNQTKVLFVLWDPNDSYATSYKYKEVEELVKKENVAVYPIGCEMKRQYFQTSQMHLENLAEISGGQSIYLSGPGFDSFGSKKFLTKESFLNQFSDLADQLQNQYILGFETEIGEHDNKWRKIKIKLEFEKELRKQIGPVRTQYRKGFYPLSKLVLDN